MKRFRFCIVAVLTIINIYNTYSQTDVLTQHNNLARTGWNNTETVLNTSNVNTNTFGLLYSRDVDDYVYAQPLVVTGVNIPSVGTKNILFVCTVNNTIYAFDADDGTVPAYWQTNYTPTGFRPPDWTDMHPGLCGGSYWDFIHGKFGLVGTPVIDKATNTLYFVTKVVSTTPGVEDNHDWPQGAASSYEYTYTSTGFYQYLHAVDLSTGAEKFGGPKNITATATGTGDGNIGGTITFDPRRQFNRAGLALSRGIIYIAYAGHCDWDPAHGWMLGYDASTLQQKMVYITTPNDGRGGIWMSGGAPAVSSVSGSLYFTTGNAFDDGIHYNDDPSIAANRGESVIKLTPNAPDHTATALNLASFFTPAGISDYNKADLDFPIQTMLIPNTKMLLTGCKDNFIYLLDTTNLGGFNSNPSGPDNVLQKINVGSNASMHSSFAYFGGAANQYIYQLSENTPLQSFAIVGNNSVGPAVNGNFSGPTYGSGGYMSVSSNGTDPSSAVLWITHPVNGCNANYSTCSGILRAMRADDVTTELWNSNMNTSDNLGIFSKMNCPTIANGKVYVNTFSNKVMVYGLTSNSACNGNPNVASTINNSSATYSASTTSSGTPANAFDGSLSTSWTGGTGSGSGKGDDAYLTVNLGAKYDVCKVVLHWGSNYGVAYNIEGSNDGANFTTISSVTSNMMTDNVTTFSTVSYQYIRMQGVTRNASGSGYIVKEMEVYGKLTNLCTTPTGLTATNITQNTATLNWQPVPTATSYTIQYKTSIVSSWVTRTTSSTSINISALTCGTAYTFTVQAVCAVGTSTQATSSFTTSNCTATCGALPTRYYSADIGDIGTAGSSCLSNNIYTLKGSGNDIGGNSDEFQYAFINVPSDEFITAQILTQDATSAINKAGLMMRDSVSNTSRFAFIGTTSGSGVVFMYRSTSSGPTTVITVPGITAPYWVRLSKNGTQYAAYISQTGAFGSWVQVGSRVDLGFGTSTVSAGMAVTSANNAVLSTATIGNFSETVGALPLKLISFTASNNNNQQILLKWTIASGANASYFDVQRSDDGKSFQSMTRVTGADNNNIVQNYSAIDYHPKTGINFYRLKQIDYDESVSFSPVVFVRFGNQEEPQIFPNPANTYFTITAGVEAIKEVSILTVSGKILKHIVNGDASPVLTIASANMASGVYIVQVTTASNVYKQKLVKD